MTSIVDTAYRPKLALIRPVHIYEPFQWKDCSCHYSSLCHQSLQNTRLSRCSLRIADIHWYLSVGPFLLRYEYCHNKTLDRSWEERRRRKRKDHQAVNHAVAADVMKARSACLASPSWAFRSSVALFLVRSSSSTLGSSSMLALKTFKIFHCVTC